MNAMLRVVRNRNLALLLSARIVSSSGDWLYQIALSVAIFQYSHGSALLVGVLWIVRLLPSVFLAPVAGLLADRWGYKRSMVTADVARMAFVALLALLLTPTNWVIIFPFVFAVTCFSKLFAPASVGIIPSLVDSRDERLAANASVMEVESVAGIVGSAIGGVVAGSGHIHALLVVQAATFGFSALSLWLVRPRERPAEIAEAAALGAEVEEEVGKGVVGGFRLLARRPLLVFAASVMVLPELASGAVLVWIVPYSINALHLGNAGVGYLYTALAFGAMIGGLAAALVGGGIRLDHLLAGSVLISGSALAFFGIWHIALVALLFIAIIGIAETVEYAAYETLLQQAVPAHMIGRASGSMDTILFNSMLVGNLLSGILVVLIGLTFSIAGLGVLIVIATILAWWNLHRETVGQPDAEALSRIEVFAGVPAATLEWAVRRMSPDRFAPGSVIIRQGEEGNKFYAIARGRVEVAVQQDGQTLTRELGKGDYFGEIALLHNVPRTATVRALDPVTTWALSREDFHELQNRAAEFRESIMAAANSRLAQGADYKLALGARAS